MNALKVMAGVSAIFLAIIYIFINIYIHVNVTDHLF